MHDIYYVAFHVVSSIFFYAEFLEFLLIRTKQSMEEGEKDGSPLAQPPYHHHGLLLLLLLLLLLRRTARP
jgi:hypothetical protein